MRILLVEDDRDDYLILADLLSEIQAPKCRMTWVSTYEAGLEALLRGPFEVCFLDFRLGARDGLSLLKEAVEAECRVPIIMLTGEDSHDVDMQATQFGAADFMVKGRLEAHLLERSLRYAVERHRVEDEQRLLSETSRVLGTSLDRAALRGLSELVVPAFASGCTIDLVERNGEIERFASIYDNPEQDAALRELRARFPISRSRAHPVRRVIETGEPIFQPEVDRAALDELAQAPEERAMVERLLPASCIVVPLSARGQTLGAMSVGRAADRRRFDERDLRTMRNVASRAALAVDNARLYEDAQEALRMRDEVLAIVSHDLRNPLGSISTAAAVLGSSSVPPETARRQLQIVTRSAERMNRLIEDLLDVTRLEAGRLTIECCNEDLGRLVEEVCEGFQSQAGGGKLTLECQIESGLPEVTLDRGRIQQALSNLIGNAIKFTPPGGRVTVRAVSGADCVRVAVSDTGPGIAAADLTSIFDRFWQGKRCDRRGAGLGLSITQGIVAAHAGRMMVESEVGKGSTFSFDLPLKPNAPLLSGDPSSTSTTGARASAFRAGSRLSPGLG